jgi:hypothetical protein
LQVGGSDTAITTDGLMLSLTKFLAFTADKKLGRPSLQEPAFLFVFNTFLFYKAKNIAH